MGQHVPPHLEIVLGWLGTAVLVVYGGVLTGVEALVEIRVITPPRDIDWKAFHWHPYLWDPYFLISGILLGLAVVHFSPVTGERRDRIMGNGRVMTRQASCRTARSDADEAANHHA